MQTVSEYVSELMAMPAPHESTEVLASIRADVLLIKLAYGSVPATQTESCEVAQ